MFVYLTNHTFTIIVPIVDRNIFIKSFLLASTSIVSSKSLQPFFWNTLYITLHFSLFFSVLFFLITLFSLFLLFLLLLTLLYNSTTFVFFRSPKMATNVQVHGWSFFFFWFSFEHPSRDYGVDPAWPEISILCFFGIFIIFFFSWNLLLTNVELKERRRLDTCDTVLLFGAD